MFGDARTADGTKKSPASNNKAKPPPMQRLMGINDLQRECRACAGRGHLVILQATARWAPTTLTPYFAGLSQTWTQRGVPVTCMTFDVDTVQSVATLFGDTRAPYFVAFPPDDTYRLDDTWFHGGAPLAFVQWAQTLVDSFQRAQKNKKERCGSRLF